MTTVYCRYPKAVHVGIGAIDLIVGSAFVNTVAVIQINN